MGSGRTTDTSELEENEERWENSMPRVKSLWK